MQNPINIEKIAELGNVSTATAYRWIKHPRFPKPAKVPRTADHGPATIKCWERQEVVNWMASENKIPPYESRLAKVEERMTVSEDEVKYRTYMIAIVLTLTASLALFRFFG